MKSLFQEATDTRDAIESALKAASEALEALKDMHPRGSMGLTPDSVKALPEYQILLYKTNHHFQQLRRFNTYYVKTFKKELTEARRNRYATTETTT